MELSRFDRICPVKIRYHYPYFQNNWRYYCFYMDDSLGGNITLMMIIQLIHVNQISDVARLGEWRDIRGLNMAATIMAVILTAQMMFHAPNRLQCEKKLCWNDKESQISGGIMAKLGVCVLWLGIILMVILGSAYALWTKDILWLYLQTLHLLIQYDKANRIFNYEPLPGFTMQSDSANNNMWCPYTLLHLLYVLHLVNW